MREAHKRSRNPNIMNKYRVKRMHVFGRNADGGWFRHELSRRGRGLAPHRAVSATAARCRPRLGSGRPKRPSSALGFLSNLLDAPKISISVSQGRLS